MSSCFAVRIRCVQSLGTRRRFRLWSYGALAAGIVLLPFGYLAARYLGVPDGPRRVLAGFAIGGVGVILFFQGIRLLVAASGRTAEGVLQMHRREADRPQSYSQAQSAAIAGDHALAAHLYEDLLARYPKDVGIARAAADFHVSGYGDVHRAESILRTLRTTNPAQEHYATQRLIDLHLGPNGERVKALSELRRLADRFPGTVDPSFPMGAGECHISCARSAPDPPRIWLPFPPYSGPVARHNDVHLIARI